MPILDGRAGFVVAVEFDAGAEDSGATFALEAATKLFGHGLEARGGNGGEVALRQFRIEATQLFGDRLEAFLFGDQRVVQEFLPLDGTEILDEMLVLAAPEDESAFGDAELFGNASEADATGAQLDKLLNRFLIFHKTFLHRRPCGPPPVGRYQTSALFREQQVRGNGLFQCRISDLMDYERKR